MYTAIMGLDGDRVAKYAEFGTKAAAAAHIKAFSDVFPAAFIVQGPEAPVSQWRVDGGKVTVAGPDMAALRASAAVARADFCNGLADIGLLTDADAVAAAKGAWPSPMEAFLEYLDPRQRRDVQIEWATRATVERNHWAVLAMISFGIATEAQADTLCGIPDLGK